MISFPSVCIEIRSLVSVSRTNHLQQEQRCKGCVTFYKILFICFSILFFPKKHFTIVLVLMKPSCAVIPSSHGAHSKHSAARVKPSRTARVLEVRGHQQRDDKYSREQQRQYTSYNDKTWWLSSRSHAFLIDPHASQPFVRLLLPGEYKSILKCKCIVNITVIHRI